MLSTGEYQDEVGHWMHVCFGPEISADKLERGDRFIEEALELAQTCPGFSKERAHALVDYVFDRPQGEINQEVGGVMVTLAALCNTFKVDIGAAAETEVARIWTKVDAIRANQGLGQQLAQANDEVRIVHKQLRCAAEDLARAMGFIDAKLDRPGPKIGHEQDQAEPFPGIDRYNR